jgi:hypothetical protein
MCQKLTHWQTPCGMEAAGPMTDEVAGAARKLEARTCQVLCQSYAPQAAQVQAPPED